MNDCSASGCRFFKKARVWKRRSAVSKAGSDFVHLCLWEKQDNPHLGK